MKTSSKPTYNKKRFHNYSKYDQDEFGVRIS